ncbi:MAG TPA: RNA polymerase sigma-70 factor [Puia sp.]|nr:RNA polymerase sigma-70 factor [Puia sp.]
MNPNEEQIWRAIQKKEGAVFEHYYKEHYKFFFLAACSYLRDPRLAQEIVNDVFIKLWEDAGTISIQSSLRSYIYRAVINRSLNELDKRKKERQYQSELSQGPEQTAEPRDMEENELKIRLYKAIDQLPEQCRRVFMMSRFENLKQQEIADRLNISIKTVKNHITRALKELHEVLGNWNSLPIWILLIEYFFWY